MSADHSEHVALRCAYADPPYLGCCRLYDHNHHDFDEGYDEWPRPFDDRCWDDLDTHKLLIGWLGDEFPDGWALSCNSTNLRDLLPLCPPDVRISPWVKPFHVYKKGVRPAYAWEAIVWRGGRNPQWGHKHPPPEKGGQATTPKDFVSANITLRKGLTGAKPPAVCEAIVAWLGLVPGDDLVDVFPGSGVMGEVTALWLGPAGPSKVHKPFTDDGVTYCGWDGHEGCGEVWPCATVRERAASGRRPNDG